MKIRKMNFSRRGFALLLAVIVVMSLAGCGSAKSAMKAAASADVAYPMEAPAAMAESAYYEPKYESFEEEYAYKTDSAVGGIAANGTAGTAPADMSEKIIYNADATVETTDFDGAVKKVYALVEELGGYMQSTGVSGSNYYNSSRGYKSLQNASFVIRVPSENFTKLTGTLSQIGNVPYCNTYSENVTQAYYDIQSRLTAYRTQETRLLEMLSIADTVEDMLAIQSQLTEVQYQIDSLTGKLKYYDNQVNYSTVTLYVEEVEEYTPQTTTKLTYGQKMVEGLKNSLKGIGRFFSDLALWIVSSLPVLILLAAVVVAVIFLVRRSIRKRRAKKASKTTPEA